MPRRFDLGRAVLVAGSALLLVSLFLKWFDSGQSGWEVFEALDLVLAGLALAGIVAALRPDLTPPWAAWAVPLAALVIVLVQIVNAPPAAGPDADPSTGAWVALAGSVLMALGAATSLTSISVTVQVADRDVRRRVAAVDRRDADEDAVAEAAVSGDEVGDIPGHERDARRGSLFGPGAAPHAGGGGGAVAASDDIERTQPLSALDDAEEAPERP